MIPSPAAASRSHIAVSRPVRYFSRRPPCCLTRLSLLPSPLTLLRPSPAGALPQPDPLLHPRLLGGDRGLRRDLAPVLRERVALDRGRARGARDGRADGAGGE